MEFIAITSILIVSGLYIAKGIYHLKAYDILNQSNYTGYLSVFLKPKFKTILQVLPIPYIKLNGVESGDAHLLIRMGNICLILLYLFIGLVLSFIILSK